MAEHQHGYLADHINPTDLLQRLSAARDAIAVAAEIDDRALDAVPAAGAIRFADGQRTLEEIAAAILKHQQHHVDTLHAALAQSAAQPGGSHFAGFPDRLDDAGIHTSRRTRTLDRPDRNSFTDVNVPLAMRPGSWDRADRVVRWSAAS